MRESIYSEFDGRLSADWIDHISETQVPFSKATAIDVLQKVSEDPDAQLVNLAVECDESLAEQCKWMIDSFQRSSSDEANVYSRLAEEQYMDAGNIATFMGQKMKSHTYVRVLASTIEGNRDDELIRFPNDLTNFDCADAIPPRTLPDGNTRDWNWQIAYMTGLGAGHTCLIVAEDAV